MQPLKTAVMTAENIKIGKTFLNCNNILHYYVTVQINTAFVGIKDLWA